jgi:hypothetical protein
MLMHMKFLIVFFVQQLHHCSVDPHVVDYVRFVMCLDYYVNACDVHCPICCVDACTTVMLIHMMILIITNV